MLCMSTVVLDTYSMSARVAQGARVAVRGASVGVTGVVARRARPVIACITRPVTKSPDLRVFSGRHDKKHEFAGKEQKLARDEFDRLLAQQSDTCEVQDTKLDTKTDEQDLADQFKTLHVSSKKFTHKYFLEMLMVAAMFVTGVFYYHELQQKEDLQKLLEALQNGYVNDEEEDCARCHTEVIEAFYSAVQVNTKYAGLANQAFADYITRTTKIPSQALCSILLLHGPDPKVIVDALDITNLEHVVCLEKTLDYYKESFRKTGDYYRDCDKKECATRKALAFTTLQQLKKLLSGLAEKDGWARPILGPKPKPKNKRFEDVRRYLDLEICELVRRAGLSDRSEGSLYRLMGSV